ncbi:MAG: hypothetical protein IJ438_04695 [Clostridia bacterium]|nr:hypothetical protein [Clostridia bacterium]
MQKINLIYDEAYEDANILLVPDWVAEQAFYWPMRYGSWLASQRCTDMETEGFVEWLNARITSEEEKVRILQQHVAVSKSEPSIDF